MIVELGHVALILAFALSLVQMAVPLLGGLRGDGRLMAAGDSIASGVAVFVALSFGALVYAYAVSDFSVLNVWQNSHSQMPFLFKLTGAWGNHEGSMLLWVLILALFAGAVAWFGADMPARLRAYVHAVQGGIIATFLLFILTTSNPFTRQALAAEGQDLNPILQDIGLAVHPPLLYLGYVGFSVTFAFAMAALIEGRIDAAWARWVRPWALAAWGFLTAGIAMGSYWAYYELGWGGFWFWDPVENASFLPWLSGTALLHSALVMEKRDALKVWTVMLAILTFSLSLLGTFLVRSGVLTSVHAFASDPTRGLFILTILCLFVGGSFAAFALRANRLQTGGLFAPVSREGALVANNLLLCTSAATVLAGTLYPIVYEGLTGAKISVGEPFFNLTFVPLVIPLVLLMPFGPLLAWRRGNLFGVTQRLMFALGAAVLVGILVAAFTRGGAVLAPVGLALAAWLIVGAFAEIWERAAFARSGFSTGLKRLAGLPRSMHATALAHAGVGVTMLGIVMVTAYETEAVGNLKPRETMQVGAFTLRHDGTREAQAGNHRAFQLRLTALRDGKEVAVLIPERRFYPARRVPTTEAAIATFGISQLYVNMGEVREGAIVVRAWYKPWVLCIWLGAVLMAFAALWSLTDRRLRIGLPVRRQAPAQASHAV